MSEINNKTDLLFSIIVPVYNVEAYVEECLDSLINQTFRNIEILVINDGSTDGSLGKVEQYARRDTRIKVVNQENQGLSAARNAGLDMATGDYVMFIDSDDYISLDVCQSAYDYIQCYGLLDVIHYGRYRVVGDQKTKVKLFWENRHRYGGREFLEKSIMADRFFAATWDKIYRRDFLAAHGLRFIKGILYEDLSFVFQCFIYAHEVGGLENCHYYYRQTEGSITNVVKEKDRDVLVTVRFLEDFCDRTVPEIREQYFFKKLVFGWVSHAVCYKYPARHPFSRRANRLVKSILHDPVFIGYVRYFAHTPGVSLKYKVASWLALNIYPLYVLLVCLNYYGRETKRQIKSTSRR